VYDKVEECTVHLFETTTPSGSLIEALICVHLAYEQLQNRLVHFRSINAVWPKCSNKIFEQAYDLHEVKHDFVSLTNFLRNLFRDRLTVYLLLFYTILTPFSTQRSRDELL